VVGELQCRVTWGTCFQGAETLCTMTEMAVALPSPIIILSGQANRNYSVTE
jgi:hypothetical protein